MSDSTLQWYTRARRLPRLIGKIPGGHDLPGGPYTVTQAVGTALVVVVGHATQGVWGVWGGLTNYAILALVALGTLVGLAFVKNTGRNPAAAGFSLLGAVAAPSQGRYRGRAIHIRAPHRARHRIVAPVPLPVAVTADSAPSREVSCDEAPVPEFVESGSLMREIVGGDATLPQPIEQDPTSVNDPDGVSADEAPTYDETERAGKKATAAPVMAMSNVQRLLADFDSKGRAS